MSTIIRTHLKDQFTAVAHTRADLVKIFKTQPNLHGTILDRSDPVQYSDLHQSYSDLFNNHNGQRKKLETLFFNSSGSNNMIYANLKLNGTIKYLNFDSDDITDLVNQILSTNPQLKSDIEFGVKTIQKRSGGETSIWLLSDYQNVKRTEERTAGKFHTDPYDTYYIQCGGAGLQLVNDNLSGLNLGHDRRADLKIMNNVDKYDPNRVYELDNYSVALMRGTINPDIIGRVWNMATSRDNLNNNPLAHRRNNEKILETGRLAFSIFRNE